MIIFTMVDYGAPDRKNNIIYGIPQRPELLIYNSPVVRMQISLTRLSAQGVPPQFLNLVKNGLFGLYSGSPVDGKINTNILIITDQ